MISKKLIRIYIDEILRPLARRKYDEALVESNILLKNYLDGMIAGIEICEAGLESLIKEEN